MDKLRVDIPHPARVYDYWLGGKDNFEADRFAGDRGLELVPEFLDYARGNRQFMARAVRFLVGQTGVRQFLDIGAGLPTSPNVHEIALAGAPDARIVYVDNDPIVYRHAQALMADNPGTTVVCDDLRDADTVLAQAAVLLDFSKPVALLFVASLHHIADADDPAGIVARYLDAAAPGSYLVLSHFTDEFAVERIGQAAREANANGAPLFPRGKDAIAGMFNGLPPIDPGLVLVSHWRPDGSVPDYNADRTWAYGAVAPIAPR